MNIKIMNALILSTFLANSVFAMQDDNLKNTTTTHTQNSKNNNLFDSSRPLTEDELNKIVENRTFSTKNGTYILKENEDIHLQIFRNDGDNKGKDSPYFAPFKSAKIKESPSGSIVKYTLNMPIVTHSTSICEYDDGDIYDYESGKFRAIESVKYEPMKFTLAFFYKKETDTMLNNQQKLCISLQNAIEVQENQSNPGLLYFLRSLLEKSKENDSFIALSPRGVFGTLYGKGEKNIANLIVEFLDIKSLSRLIRTSKEMQKLFDTERSWKTMAKRYNLGEPLDTQMQRMQSTKKWVKYRTEDTKVHMLKDFDPLSDDMFKTIMLNMTLTTDQGTFKLQNLYEAEYVFKDFEEIGNNSLGCFSLNTCQYTAEGLEIKFMRPDQNWSPPLIDPITNEEIYDPYHGVIFRILFLKKEEQGK